MCSVDPLPTPSANSDTPYIWHICPYRTNVSRVQDEEAEEDAINTPNISPRRRRRIFREHQLRQEGRTLEQIADAVNVSVATVHADLKLLEEHWILLVQDIHNDLLLHQIVRLERRVEHLSQLDPVADARRALGPDAELSYDQLIQIEDRHERRLARAERELRMLLRQLNKPHVSRGFRFVDYPEDELADPETDRTNLKEPESVSPTIPAKTLEIVANGAAEKKLAENLKMPPSPPPSRDLPLPRDTGRNQPCPCGSGRKRKRCHPRESGSPPSGEARPALDAGMARSDRGGGPDPILAPEHEAEALRLTDQYHAAQEANDPLAQVNALTELVDLYAR